MMKQNLKKIYPKRTTICKLKRGGNSCPVIIRSTNYLKFSVLRIVTKFDSERTANKTPQNVRKKRKCTKAFLTRQKRLLKADPTQSMTKLAKQRNVSKRTIR